MSYQRLTDKVKINFKASYNLLIEKISRKYISKHIILLIYKTYINSHKGTLFYWFYLNKF